MSAVLGRRRVLVLEDEALVAMLLETILRDQGCEVVGPVNTLSDALSVAQGDEPLDAALLDVQLGKETCFAAAEALMARNVPVVFSSGHGKAALPSEWRDHPVLQKPFNEVAIRAALMRAMKISQA